MKPPTKELLGKRLLLQHEQRGPVEGIFRNITSFSIAIMEDGFLTWISLDELEGWELVERPEHYEELQAGIDKLENGEPMSTEERMALLAHIEQMEAREKRYKEAEEAMFPPK